MSKATMNCRHCDVEFQYRVTKNNGRPRMYCSRPCADATAQVRRTQKGSINTCGYCDNVFHATYKSTKYCSAECRKAVQKLQDQERKRRAKKQHQEHRVDPLSFGCELCPSLAYMHNPPIVLPYDRVCRACMECLVEGMAAEAVW